MFDTINIPLSILPKGDVPKFRSKDIKIWQTSSFCADMGEFKITADMMLLKNEPTLQEIPNDELPFPEIPYYKQYIDEGTKEWVPFLFTGKVKFHTYVGEELIKFESDAYLGKISNITKMK